MKQGNQFYLEVELYDVNNNKLNPNSADKIVFTFDKLVKEYPSVDVEYDENNELFKIWLTQEETFEMKKNIPIEARIKFKNNTIMGSEIITKYIYDSLNKDVL